MKIFGKKGIECRYQSNKAKLAGFEGYIYGQTKAPAAGLKYGSAEKDISSVGCGVAAIYNVMKFIGKPQSFADVVKDAELLGLPFFGGRFGTKTKKLGRYFRLHNVNFTEYRSFEKFTKALPGSKISIIVSWNDKITDGIHFYCVYPDEESSYKSINYYSSDRPFDFNPGNLRKDRFVIAYGFYTNT